MTVDDLLLLGFLTGVEGIDATWLYLFPSGDCRAKGKQELRVPISFPSERPKEAQDD